jgi:hypothetical protein
LRGNYTKLDISVAFGLVHSSGRLVSSFSVINVLRVFLPEDLSFAFFEQSVAIKS